MRAGPLSNDKVISLINNHFVPVYISNEDYAKGGSAPAEEKAERNRIYGEALKAKLSAGTVHVYILEDGHPIDSLHVATASKPDRLIELLERAIDKLKAPPGKPVVEPARQSHPPKATADSLILHLTARYLTPKGDDYVPFPVKLGGSNHGWAAYPSEDWVVLNPAEWSKLLPTGPVANGDSWQLNQRVANKILTHFYPPTENNDVSTNRIDRQALDATVLSTDGGQVRARLDGSLKMKHPFYHKDDDNSVEATVVGLMEFEPAGKKIRSLRLVTQTATYGRQHFGVAVRSLP